MGAPTRIPLITLALLTFFIAHPGSAAADEAVLDEDAIRTVLAGNTVAGVKDGQPWRQSFTATGQTTYYAGSSAPSDGFWRIQDNAYCSKWPPFGGWACYEMTGDLSASPQTVTFIGSGGDKWPAHVQ